MWMLTNYIPLNKPANSPVHVGLRLLLLESLQLEGLQFPFD